MEKITATFEGYEIREKKVAKIGNSGHILVPVSWIGKKVKVVLLEPVDEN